MNQGFFKVFTRIETYDQTRPFKAWLGKIMMNASIDYYRANLKMAYTDDLETVEHLSDGDTADKKLNYEDLLRMVQKLPTAYRTVFNLFAIEGYTHEEIGELLNISPGTSKSNLHKARQKLKHMIAEAESPSANRNYEGGADYSHIVAIKKADRSGIFFDKNRGNNC
jgi:RNA polymerase sigma-70 factor (ECF subfamily)